MDGFIPDMSPARNPLGSHSLLHPKHHVFENNIQIMTMHPELEDAFNWGLPIPEVIKIFTKHHSGPIEERIHPYFPDFNELVHTHCSFWDTWQPLFQRLSWVSFVDGHKAVSEPYLSIHKALTRDILSWLCDSERRSNIYFIAEPQMPMSHVIENTRANVLANICYDARRFGLPFRNKPESLWHSIEWMSSELAAFYPPFRRILTRKLIDNPETVKLPTRTRFKKLIHEPWKALQESHPQYINTPPVVVLRWDYGELDEELLRLICEFGSSRYSPSLLWIISIDTKLKLPIQDLLDPSAPFRYFRLPVCYNEGPADAALILHHSFSALRHKHKEMFDEDEVWPSEEQMSQLIRVVSGALDSVDIIIQLMDLEDHGGPKAHLESFLAYTVDSPSPSDERPYCALDHFYTRTLSNIPPDLLSVAKRVFNIIFYYGIYGVTSLQLACLLSLGNGTFIPHLYRLAVIRADELCDRNSFFRDFLENPTRSGRFYTPFSESSLCTFQAFLHILSHASNLTAIMKPALRWIQVDPSAYRTKIEQLRKDACLEFCFPQKAAFESSWTVLHRFDFRCLAHTCGIVRSSDFMLFLRKLYALSKVNSVNIVRIEPIGLLDRQFIDKCEGVVEPLDLEKMEWPTSFQECRLQVMDPKYVLLGFDNETVLAVLASQKAYGSDKCSDLDVTIYTSAMLDYM